MMFSALVNISSWFIGAKTPASVFHEPVMVPALDPETDPVIVPVREPVMVPVREPVMVPVLDPVIVPTLVVLDPVMVPARAATESDKVSITANMICPRRVM